MSNEVFPILIVDDEPNIRTGLARALECESYAIATAGDAGEALRQFRITHHPLVLTDLKMPGASTGIDLIRSIKDERPETLIIVITAHGTVETAVEAMRLGAHDYLSKPIDLGTLRLQVRNAFEHYRLKEENRRLRESGWP
jgi:two-component system NtrC family response regulator